MSCGCPSSVTLKSFAVSPSMTLPSLVLHRDRLDDEARRGAKDRLLCLLLLLRGATLRPERRHDENPDNSQRPTPQLPTLGVGRLGSWELTPLGGGQKRHAQNLIRRLVCTRRIWLASLGRPNCGLLTSVFTLGVRDVVEHVGGIDAPVHVEPAAPRERARDARVQCELGRAACGVASGVTPFTRCRRGVRRRVQVVARPVHPSTRPSARRESRP